MAANGRLRAAEGWFHVQMCLFWGIYLETRCGFCPNEAGELGKIHPNTTLATALNGHSGSGGQGAAWVPLVLSVRCADQTRESPSSINQTPGFPAPGGREQEASLGRTVCTDQRVVLLGSSLSWGEVGLGIACDI